MALSKSKNRALGMRCSRNVWMPLRSSFGRNHDAQRGITRGSVLIGDGGFFLRASWSSLGETRYEERFRCVVMFAYKPFPAHRERPTLVAQVVARITMAKHGVFLSRSRDVGGQTTAVGYVCRPVACHCYIRLRSEGSPRCDADRQIVGERVRCAGARRAGYTVTYQQTKLWCLNARLLYAMRLVTSNPHEVGSFRRSVADR